MENDDEADDDEADEADDDEIDAGGRAVKIKGFTLLAWAR